MKESKLTCENLVNSLAALPKSVTYNYINKATRTSLKIVDVQKPYGPITICRWNEEKGETAAKAVPQTISKEMLFRIANAVQEGLPINVDRILGASYNTRSALETLICHTPQFYYCYPGRIENKNGITKIKAGHKHIIWLPDEPHAQATLVERKLENLEINEIPTKNVVYNALELPPHVEANSVAGLDPQTARMHLLMQMAIYEIGKSLGFSTYIAQNDSGAKYKGKLLIDHPQIVKSLVDQPTVAPFDDAADSGKLIDAMWFTKRSIPAVFEVEHSTGVTSGLTRMAGFKDRIPSYQDMRFVIVADDDLREKVIKEINKPQFKELHAYYLPYSAVNELLSLCQSRHLKGITDRFIDTFLEDVYVESEE